MKARPLSEVCKVNPRTDAGLSSAQQCSFIPMEYVDDRFGVITRKAVRKVGEVEKGYTFFKNNDVLFAKITPCMENGKAAIAKDLVNGIGFGSTEFHVIRANGSITPEWVYYFLRQEWVRKYAEKRMTGSAGQKRVPSTVLEEVEIPLPSTKEYQKYVASILGKADRLRRTRHYAQQLSDTFLQSVFVEMFGDPAKNPKGWNVAELSKACVDKNGIKAGPFGSAIKKETYSLAGYRIYGQEQVIGGDFRIGNYRIDERKYQEFKEYAVASNDVLVSLVGTFGKAIVVPDDIEPGIINPRLIRIRPNSKILNSYFLLSIFRNTSFLRKLERLSHGGTMGILNATQLKEVEIYLPPLPLQEKFARIVHRFERLRAQQREATRQAEHLFQTLLHRAFRGEL